MSWLKSTEPFVSITCPNMLMIGYVLVWDQLLDVITWNEEMFKIEKL